MSGGVAYVLDEDGTFGERCNMGLVGFDEIDESDAIELHGLIEEHAERTDSPGRRAHPRRLGELPAAFMKVMPHDYKRALRELERPSRRCSRSSRAESTGGEGFVHDGAEL